MTSNTTNISPDLIDKLIRCLDKVEPLIPTALPPVDFSTSLAARWAVRQFDAGLEAIPTIEPTQLADVLGAKRAKEALDKNTQHFVNGNLANNALLWGPKGTGKSSLIRALLNEYADSGLRVIEVDKDHLVDLHRITSTLIDLPYRFILFSDDLSFESNDGSYKALKAVLDGSLAAQPENILIYATSNRRHLLPEKASDNQQTQVVESGCEWELHHNEAIEEKISLSERFGLWLSFQPFNQSQYLDVVAHWLAKTDASIVFDETVRKNALEWALTRGSRSGRVARQFVINYFADQ